MVGVEPSASPPLEKKIRRITLIWKLAGVALSAASIAAASIAIATAQPNENGSANANEHAQNAPGIGVAGVAGNGPRPVLGAIKGFAPDAAQNGLSTALSHVPTTTPVPTP
jgi:hypothetical protein